ncbi:ATP-binding cassette, subfamily B, MsbA [Paenibacillus sp. 1_12]|uniref:ABC transporter ATP-binding protein n=1 Tax=Paenibacillus sp. 1_12 TaxID=1566278 RepID=UPI0008E227E8|nr:ABC transporter ATP-binding protein [Paenibacillus sp. 1_12]SFL58618.1 ATP-binding cassette, subfamily B, MsbA [Paenibacillus sp. 1_12]
MNYVWLWTYVAQRKGLYLIALVVLVIMAVSGIGMVGVQKMILDDLLVQRQYDRMFTVLGWLALSMVLYYVSQTLSNILMLSNQLFFQRQLTKCLMNSLHRISAQNYRNSRVADLMHYFNQDAVETAKTISHYIPSGLQKIATMIILLYIVGSESWVIVISAIGLGILYICISKYYGIRLKHAAKEVQESRAKYQVGMEEGISSVRETVAYNRIGWQTDKLNKLFLLYFSKILNEGKLMNKQLFTSEPIKWGVVLLVLGFGGYQVMHGSMSIGMFIITFHFSTQLIYAVHAVYFFVIEISQKMAHVERLRSFTSLDSNSEKGNTLEDPIDSIVFDCIRFKYEEDGQEILSDLKCTVSAGNHVAFVGSSGAGKSTLVQLLLRFVEPDSGEIRINNISLYDLNNSEWMKRIAVVSQEPYLFPESIIFNLKMGEEYSNKVIEEICRLTDIHDYIMSLSDGYETKIGERGITLSGGQRQRISLARALLRNPEVLILDEATSQLDMETERNIMQNIKCARKNKIMIIIAHRLSTVENSDVIFYVADGRIVEQGNHSSLMDLQGEYSGLVLRQHMSAR